MSTNPNRSDMTIDAVPDFQTDSAAGFNSQYTSDLREKTWISAAQASMIPKMAATVLIKVAMTKILIFFLLHRDNAVLSVGLKT